MNKIVFVMFRDKTGQGLIGLAQETAKDLGVSDDNPILVKKGDKQVKLKAWIVPHRNDLNPSGVCLDKKTRNKLGVRAVVDWDDEPDMVEVSKA